ncbi:MAG: Ig-like domain-containing protein [Polyangia bacterium]
MAKSRPSFLLYPTFCFLAFCFLSIATASSARAQQLEIHYINVGWGSAVLVKGPDGTTVLLEAGDDGRGASAVVPYLKSIGVRPADGIDYVIGGHQHCDHIGGLDEVLAAGYDVTGKSYYNGSPTSSGCVSDWNAAAARTTAGAPVVPAVGSQIPLGGGARLTFLAVNGSIIGGGKVAVANENDRSIAILVQHGGFDYLWASDLGGGNVDEACTGRYTPTQVDVETAVITAISPGGASPLITAGGIDVLNVNHHGSESSTNKNWMNYAQPAVALIATGGGQDTDWNFPRRDVVDGVLRAGASACITAAPALVLQTEDGDPAGAQTSFTGYSVGNIKVLTDGVHDFTVSADGQVSQGASEVTLAGLPKTLALDDATGRDVTPPRVSITAPAGGATVAGTVAVTATATDDVRVSYVEFYLDGALKATDSSAAYAWSFDTRSVGNGSHTLKALAYDAAGNRGTSTLITVTVQNPVGTNVSGWKVAQMNSSYSYVLPTGTVIPPRGYLIIARNATRAAFQSFWKVSLGPDVVFLNAASALPVLNGDESYALYTAGGTLVDGRTTDMPAGGGKTLQRKGPCLAPGASGSWSVQPVAAATPGSGAGSSCGKGVVINEFADPPATGDYVFEFIEIYNDK